MGAFGCLQPALRSALNTGFLIGVTFLLSMQMLVLAVLSAGGVSTKGSSPTPAERAVAAFSVLLFLGYVRLPSLPPCVCLSR